MYHFSISATLVSEIEQEIQVLEEDIFSEYTFQLSTAPDIVMPVQKSLSMHTNPSDRKSPLWRFFSFRGTLNQSEFLYSMTPLLILLTFWLYTFGLPVLTCFGCALTLPIVWSIMAQSTRRIRDLGGNAYLVLLYLIPCINISLLLYLLLASSKTNSSWIIDRRISILLFTRQLANVAVYRYLGWGRRENALGA